MGLGGPCVVALTGAKLSKCEKQFDLRLRHIPNGSFRLHSKDADVPPEAPRSVESTLFSELKMIKLRSVCGTVPLARYNSSSSGSHTTSHALRQKQQRQRELYDRFLRVDHAGELGADRIYAGQMAVLGRTSVGPVIQEMWDQEKYHLETFQKLISKHGTRPTALLPFWNLAGFALGAGTALLGKESAMACTVAVESVITDHYNDQIRQLVEDDPEEHRDLLEVLKQFRDDEQHHHDTGLEHEAEQAPFYKALTSFIKTGCKAAIFVAERV